MHVVFTIAGLAPRFGGPSRSVPLLSNALRSQGAPTDILSLRERRDRMSPLADALQDVTWVECATHRYLPLGWPRRFKSQLRRMLRESADTVVHDAGLWLPSNRYVAEIARESRVPRVVSARGMLSEWALRHGSACKKLMWRLGQKNDLESASLLHATAEAEAQEFRNCGLRTAIAVVPNGVDTPAHTQIEDRGGRPGRVVLFLSRIHPKKGLLDLVKAWAAVRPFGWRLVVGGDDEGGHRQTVERAAAEQGVREEIDFVGPVADAEKWQVYATADLFVLPSYSENFGIVIAEALAAGVPVITTRGTPWSELQSHRCGWWIDPGAVPLAAALREATGASDEMRHDMGKRGRNLVITRYSWDSAAEKMLACYKWVLGQHGKPNWVTQADES